MYLSNHANCIKIREAVFFILIIHFMFPLHRFNIASGWSSLLRYDSELFLKYWNTMSVFHCVVIVLSLWQLSQRSMHTHTLLTTLYCSIPFSFIIILEFSKLSFFKIYFLGFKKLQYDQVVVWNVQFIGMFVKIPSKEIYHLEIKILSQQRLTMKRMKIKILQVCSYARLKFPLLLYNLWTHIF